LLKKVLYRMFEALEAVYKFVAIFSWRERRTFLTRYAKRNTTHILLRSCNCAS
jgi:hypothetical protein